MNRKGQMNMVGVLIVLAITLIVGAILLQGAAQNVGTAINTVELANQSAGAVVADNTAFYVTNVKSLSNVVIYNATGNNVVDASNYTVTNNVVYNGQEAVQILPGTVPNAYNSNWKISGTGQPLTYIAESGGRSMADLIVVLMALALVAVAVGYAIKGYKDTM